MSTFTSTNNSSNSSNTAAAAAKDPAIVAMGTDANENKKVYDEWAEQYEENVRRWGYDMPEQVTQLLQRQDVISKILATTTNNMAENGTLVSILDAGAGDGLVGVALQKAFGNVHKENTSSSSYTLELTGIDISAKMLQLAQERHNHCYTTTRVVNLNDDDDDTTPFPDDTFHIITCVGTMTYLDPSKVLPELVRICKPQCGYICYTNRTDHLHLAEPEVRSISIFVCLVQKCLYLPKWFVIFFLLLLTYILYYNHPYIYIGATFDSFQSMGTSGTSWTHAIFARKSRIW